MSARATLLAIAVAAACFAQASPHPVNTHVRHIRHLREHNSMKLNEAVGKTVCEFKVDEDINESRVPRLVKHVRCVPPPDRGAKHCCVHSKHHACVQLQDTIFVEFLHKDGTKKESRMEVDVGCVCTRVGVDAGRAPSPGFS